MFFTQEQNIFTGVSGAVYSIQDFVLKLHTIYYNTGFPELTIISFVEKEQHHHQEQDGTKLHTNATNSFGKPGIFCKLSTVDVHLCYIVSRALCA